MSKLLIESANAVRILKFNRPEKINAFDAELWQLFADGLNDADQDASIKSVIVNQGMRLKRMKARARGRADRIIKPTCHIEIILVEGDK